MDIRFSTYHEPLRRIPSTSTVTDFEDFAFPNLRRLYRFTVADIKNYSNPINTKIIVFLGINQNNLYYDIINYTYKSENSDRSEHETASLSA